MAAHIDGMKKIPAAELTDEQSAVILDHLITTTDVIADDQRERLVRSCECGERFEVRPAELPDGSDPELVLHDSWIEHVWKKVHEV